MQFTILRFTMKFTAIISLAAFAIPALAVTQYTVSYDPIYDVGSTSLDQVACSNGANGLESDGYTNFKSIPSFPYIGGAPQIAGWNSKYCGSCWKLAYTVKGKTTSINVTALDTGDQDLEGFNISLEAMNALTGGKAKDLGRVSITATQVDGGACKL
ncbi:Cerato-platanin-domain-containing protein [Hygrophoropsis aurantiaca]|uniref:Cerato-platanin-domain-containing protein n=1 Tax=Hygrophoropsis aurantiaca TaxID=72124 RepID=A0ACB8AJ14_9AGAM|nr:Cerato-platanin-domain-containing protein [Hygrophoropsis aurantiaca]